MKGERFESDREASSTTRSSDDRRGRVPTRRTDPVASLHRAAGNRTVQRVVESGRFDARDHPVVRAGSTITRPTVSKETEEEDSDGETKTHDVEKGDTLWDLAGDEYGDPVTWPTIANESGIDDPRSLAFGTKDRDEDGSGDASNDEE